MSLIKEKDFVRINSTYFQGVGKVVEKHDDEAMTYYVNLGENIEVFREREVSLWLPLEDELVVLVNKESTNHFTVVKYNINYKGFELEPYMYSIPQYWGEK